MGMSAASSGTPQATTSTAATPSELLDLIVPSMHHNARCNNNARWERGQGGGHTSMYSYWEVFRAPEAYEEPR